MIDDCVGEGGMGRVYLAHHARLARRKFAVKILLGELAASPEMRRRFEQEAQAASRLDHPNVVPVLDFGQRGGLLYIVMEFVKGQTLAKLIAEGPLQERRMLDISRQLCLGLAHAHEHDLVHRDFKPENVVVVETENGEVPRILDFGLAIISDPGEAATRLTSAGMILGTPAYISPEQASGKDVDHRADLFALGTTMYEMLAGTIPYDGSVMELLASNAMKAAPAIAERTPGVVVSAELERIVFKLLAKDPDDRFSSAREAIAAIDAMRNGRGSVVQDVALEDTGPQQSVSTPQVVATAAETAVEPVAELVAEPEPTQQVEERGKRRRMWLPLALLGAAALGLVMFMVVGANKSKSKSDSGSNAGVASTKASNGVKTPATPRDADASNTVVAPTTTSDANTKPEGSGDTKPETVDGGTTKAVSKTPPKPRATVASRHVRKVPRRRVPTTTTNTVKTPDKDPEPIVASVTKTPVLPPPVLPPPVATPPKPTPKPKPQVKPAPRLDAHAAIVGFSARGSMSSQKVRRAVDRVASSFRSCYKSAARSARRDVAGIVSVTLRIGESRRAQSISVGSAPLPGLSSCIKSALRRVRTRRAPDVGTVRVSFKLRYTPIQP